MPLAILRHGRAVDRAVWTGPDAERPLTTNGQQRTAAVCRGLAGLVAREGLSSLWTSPYQRAAQTAVIAEAAWRLSAMQQPWLGAEDWSLDAALASLVAAEVVHNAPILVGHEPDLGDLIGVLTGGPAVPLKKAGFALLHGQPVPGGMQLTTLLRPRDVLQLHN